MTKYHERGTLAAGGGIACKQVSGSWARKFHRPVRTGSGGMLVAEITVFFYLEEQETETGTRTNLIRGEDYLLLLPSFDPLVADTHYRNHRDTVVEVEPDQLTEEHCKFLCSQVSAAEFTWDGLPGAEVPCEVAGLALAGGRWSAHCTAHDVTSMAAFGSEAEAVRGFVCDRGHRWRFLLSYPDNESGEPPEFADLTKLRQWVTSAVQGAHYGEDVPRGDPMITRVVTGRTLEKATLRQVPGTGEWQRPDDDRGPTMGYPEFVVAGGGIEYVRFTVPLNGDA